MLDKKPQNLRSRGPDATDPIGLKLEFKVADEIAITEFRLNESHQRPAGTAHNGILAFLMDEGMGWIARHVGGVTSVTAKIEVNYYNPAPIDEVLIMTVRIGNRNKRLLNEIARIERQDGTLIAEGTCIQYVIDLSQNSQKAVQSQV